SYEKNNMLDITYGESLQEQEQVMHFIHGEKAEIHIQQMMDHSNPQHLQQKLDKLALQAEELIAKVDDETDVAFVSPKILQLLEEWSSIDSQMQDELYKNESHSNVDIIQSQANQHINSDFIEKELHELIDMLQNKLSGAKLSNQERLRFADWINILSGLDASLSSSSILSLLEKIEGELEQLTNDQKLNHPKRAPLQIRLAKLITTLNNGEMTNKAHDALSKGQQVTKETALWKELVQVYQKRKSLASTYRTDASVQSKDVSKWLSNAIEGQTATAKVVNPTSVSFTSLPMSKIEQYVIHLNHTQSGSSVEQQIIDKFQKIMQTSKFLSQP